MIQRRSVLGMLAGSAGIVASGAWARARPPRIGVVGAGIVGASIASHLAEAGAQVTVFDRIGPAAGATRNSFAWINAFVADPNYRDLRLQSLLAYHDLDRRLGLGIVWGGYLNWANDAAQAGLVRSNAGQLAGSPFPVQWLDAAQVASPEPAPGARPGGGGHLFRH